MTITHDQISQRAREIWEREGRPEGRDKEHWLQAEAELRQESNPGSSQASSSDTEMVRAMAGNAKAENDLRKKGPRRGK